MRFKMMTAVAAVAITMPVLAQTDSATPAPKPIKEKKVCRSEEVTGSILGGKTVCHTKDEWSRIDSANAAAAGDALDNARRSVQGR